jgi:hypothetical protein
MSLPSLLRTLTCLCLLAPVAGATAGPYAQSEHAAPAYRLNSLAASLADQPAPLRADLARITLEELATAYSEEAQRARSDAYRRKDGGELWRWARAVEGLATDYSALAAEIYPDTPVELDTSPEGSLYLIVAGRPVIASCPRVREQTGFEQRVIARFCELNRCDGLLEEPVQDAAAPPGPEPARAVLQWSFSQQAGPVCASSDGLEFQFLNRENLGPKREACTRAVTELNALVDAIARESAAGVRVDWNRFTIQHLPDGEEQVLLNGEGDYLRLALPTLVARQELVRTVLPWLAARISGRPYTLVVINAGRVLAPAGHPLE